MTTVRDVQASMFPDIKPDRPVGPIPASVHDGTNAELMAKLAPLYLNGSVLDVTYGDGKWWTSFTPDPFTFHDLHKVDGVDFTDLPHPDRSFDTVCFDPPYVVSGGESDKGAAFQKAYGIGTQRLGKSQPVGRERRFEQLLHDGLIECARVADRWLLVKCMEFAQGSFAHNDFHDIPYLMTKWAVEEAGMVKHDQIVHHAGSGPGGHNIYTVKRARRHHSYLLVFRPRKASA